MENILYLTANQIVGRVGKSTDIIKAVTNEEYVEFMHVSTSIEDIINTWIKWIKAYMVVRSYPVNKKETLSIYWRVKPEISKCGKDKKRVYARLLISDMEEICK